MKPVLRLLLLTLAAFLGSLFASPDAEAISWKTAPDEIFSGTVENAGENGPSAREQCRINGWLNYDTASEYTVAARTPGSFITNTRLEVQALQRQGLSRSDAFAQIRRFNAGNADGYLFHFTQQAGARGILRDGMIRPSSGGVWGPGVYSGTTPVPGSILKNIPFAGWGLGGKGANVRIPFRTTQPSVTPWLPPRTRVFRDPVPLGGGL